MDVRTQQPELEQLSEFVHDECHKRLKAYEAQPRDAAEHFETENEVLSGGYAYRQLYELVQNAADAILEAKEPHGRICVRLTRDLLEAANTGAALDEGGIIALLNARSSPKRGNQIGRFGIGFKSLLKLGGRVDLTSKSVGLRFDPEACRNRIRDHLGLAPDARAPGMRLAAVLDPNETGSPLSGNGKWNWATTVVSAEIADESTFERLKKELAEFPAEFLLFLSSDISLELEVEGVEPRIINKRFEGGNAVVSDGTNEAMWKIFETRVSVENPEARSDATHIQARDQVPLAWAVPVGGREQAGRFWAFFPTETQSRTLGILNAPWKLNSDRTNLIRGPWNEAIMQAAAELIGASLSSLSTAAGDDVAVAVIGRTGRRCQVAIENRELYEPVEQSERLVVGDMLLGLRRENVGQQQVRGGVRRLSGPSRGGVGAMPKTDANPMQSAHNAPRCHAKAKTTGERCKSPARRGWQVCRMHGAGGGAPSGPANGSWAHGDRSKEGEQDRKTLMALVKLARDSVTALGD